MLADRRDRSQQFFDDLRARVVAAHPERMHDIFPEWRSIEELERAAYGDGDPDSVDDSRIEWRVPQTAAEHAEVERWLAEHMAGTITAAALPDGGWV